MELTTVQHQQKVEIMEKYLELGLKDGFKSVLLDQVASELSISKKTIYKLYTNKEALIMACIDHVFQSIDDTIAPIIRDPSMDIIDKIIRLLTMVSEKLSFFTMQQVGEIQQLYPDLWEHVVQERNIRLERYEMLFEAARKKGVIRDIDPKIIVQLLMHSIDEFTKEGVMKEHNLTYSQSLSLITSILFEGILKPNK